MKTEAIIVLRKYYDDALSLLWEIIKAEDAESIGLEKFLFETNYKEDVIVSFFNEAEDNKLKYGYSIIVGYVQSVFQDVIDNISNNGFTHKYDDFTDSIIIRGGVEVGCALSLKEILSDIETILVCSSEGDYEGVYKDYFSKNETNDNDEYAPESRFDFDETEKESNKKGSLKDKLVFFIEKKAEFDKVSKSGGLIFKVDDTSFDIKCDIEIAKLKELLNLGLDNTSVENDNELSGTPASLQSLAIEYLLSELGVDLQNTEKTKIAGFMQFITGRQIKSKPSNSSFYKIIGKAPSTVGEKEEYNKRCDSVAEQFEQIGLINIANKIRNGKEG